MWNGLTSITAPISGEGFSSVSVKNKFFININPWFPYCTELGNSKLHFKLKNLIFISVTATEGMCELEWQLCFHHTYCIQLRNFIVIRILSVTLVEYSIKILVIHILKRILDYVLTIICKFQIYSCIQYEHCTSYRRNEQIP
jgi:hypothetical protein